ncbi:hypothetical protein ABZP36_032090 [Zizania latifolia]
MVALWKRKPKPEPGRMCKAKSSVATTASISSMAGTSSTTTPRKQQQRSPRTTATQYSTSSAAPSTSSSSTASLQALRDSLPDLPLLLTFHELAAATANFSSSHRLAPSANSSSSFRCTIRGHSAAVFRRPLRRDPAHVFARLAVLGHCHHAAIARLLGAAASPDGSVFLAYELLPDASPLSSLLRNPNNPSFTPLASWQSRLKIAADICDALHYVHLQADTVHNRLSSSTVLVCGDGPRLRAKVAHFGAADLAGELPDSDKTDQDSGGGYRRTGSRGRRIEGTRGYMAPELITGGSPSRRSDVYALGVVLLELVSGQEPLRYEYNKATGEGKRTSLIESAEATAAEGGGEAMRRWVDRRLKDSFPVDAAEGLTTLALRCVAKETAARPDMSWVAANVSKLFLEAQDWADKFRFPTDISISIAPR